MAFGKAHCGVGFIRVKTSGKLTNKEAAQAMGAGGDNQQSLSEDPAAAESTNAGNAPFSAFDAFFVHGTTGLFLPHLERGEYLVNVSRAWDLVGL